MNKVLIKFTEIRIIQSLIKVERSGDKLLEDLKLYKFKHERFNIQLTNIHSKADFIKEIDNIFESIDQNYFPIIHFEMHGNTEGMRLLSGEFITYNELWKYLTKINVALKNNLVICMGTCYGGYSEIENYQILADGERSPYFLLVAPRTEVNFQQIYDEYINFYKSILNEETEINPLSKKQFYKTTSERHINRLIRGMKIDSGSMKFFKESRKILKKKIRNDDDPYPGRPHNMKLKFLNNDRVDFLKNQLKGLRDFFLMIDLDKMNEQRFQNFEKVWLKKEGDT